MLRTFLIALAFASAVAGAIAAEVRWEPAGGTLGVGQTSPLELVFDDCEPTGAVTLPTVPDVSFGRPSQSSQTSIVNFKMSRRTVLSYPVLPIRKGRMTIPSFDVETDSGRQTVKSVTFEIGDATVGRSNLSIESIAGSQLTTDASTVWAGQVFSLKYDLLIVRRFNPTGVANLDWTAPPGLVTEPWSEPQNISAIVGNESRVGIEYSTRAYARDSGTLTIPPASQMINLEVGSSAFGLFQRPNIEQYLITSSRATLNVRPLPSPAPADFLKAVGEFKLESTVVPQAAAVGEPVTWTLKLEGTGNWPEGLSLPAREVSNDFQLIRPQVNRTTKEGTLFEGSVTEDVVLVPTKPGTYTLGPVSYSFFNPKEGRYQTITTNTVTVIVRPAVTAGATAPDAGVFSFTPADPVQKTPAPTQPGRIPLDPLEGAATAMLPSAGLPVGWLLAPGVPLLLAWLAFALRRASATDPLRPQREAQARMPAVLAAVKAASNPAETAAALRAWQNTAVDIFGRKRAAPSPSEFMFAASQFLTPAAAEAWRALWIEAEAAIYGESVPLPGDWALRAAAAARALRLPGFSPLSALRPANLWPAVVLAALFALPRDTGAATDPRAAYDSGDFAGAERGWREQLTADPLNWKAHNNLGLALAQQERWSEAAAHWAAAFAQNPAEPATRFQFELGVARAEFTSPELARFADGRGATWLARRASPAQWQAVLGLASLLAAGAGVLYLWDRYSGRRRWRFYAAAALLAGGVAAAATSTGALHSWGPIADPEIALVWTPTELRSIPTEAAEQETQPLGAGTLAPVKHRFLGWAQLEFPDGQTGWVRSETVVPFYR